MEIIVAIITRQRHSKNVPAATKKDATIKDSVFSMNPFLGKDVANM